MAKVDVQMPARLGHFRHYLKTHTKLIVSFVFVLFSMALMIGTAVSYTKISSLSEYSNSMYAKSLDLETEIDEKDATLSTLQADLEQISSEYEELRSEDQKVRNDELQYDIQKIEETYSTAVVTYENLLDLKEVSKKTQEYDEMYAQALALLAERSYASAEAVLAELNQDIDDKREEIVTAYQIPESVPVDNTAPSSGYRRQQVQTDVGTFMVSVVAADLNSVKVIVDTASGEDCANDCPVLDLGSYVARNGAIAGVNGGYFCPATYPSCAGKTNSFDTLLMNKDKTYFNSDNNVYSTVPAVIFSGGGARFVGASSEWGRDTGVDAVIANHPLLVSGGNVVFGGDGDPKKGSKGPRGFIGTNGSTVYIGVVHNATVAESARALKGMGIRNALNLDGGGSAALWSGGYKVGPGRNIPNAILLVGK